MLFETYSRKNYWYEASDGDSFASQLRFDAYASYISALQVASHKNCH